MHNDQGTWNVQGTDITSERNVQGTDITSERNVQGTVITSKRNVKGTYITSERNVQGTDITNAKLSYKDKFQLCSRTERQTLRQSDIVDHRAGYFRAKNFVLVFLIKYIFILSSSGPGPGRVKVR